MSRLPTHDRDRTRIELRQRISLIPEALGERSARMSPMWCAL
jgi:hypothetical protein